MRSLRICRRAAPPIVHDWPDDLHPLLARVFAARGLSPHEVMRRRLVDLAMPAALGGITRACARLVQAIDGDEAICIVGDFDADGATATALLVRGLRLLGARNVAYRVPHRAREGYGLSPVLVASLCAESIAVPNLIITVDNGISSHAGVALARAHGIDVIVTDHHLPGATLPDACAIVNPNLAGDAFPSKALAGVGVAFYVLLGLRACLREGGKFTTAGVAGTREPDLAALLDLVALGTVADLVPLDANNRILVAAGVQRMRAGRSCAGIAALIRAAGRDAQRIVATDLGFAVGPRINAAGRLDDMRVGIECLLTDDIARADELAAQLSRINADRQHLQTAMVDEADAKVAEFLTLHGDARLPHGVVLHDAGWHPGVIGLVASKLKERLHRPVVACAPAAPGSDELRCSARSIAGFHLRDALAEVDSIAPDLIARFGGHAMAAGLTLAHDKLARFAAEFDAVARRRIAAEDLDATLWSDGALAADELNCRAAQALIDGGPWGQGFPEPLFDNVFTLDAARVVGERHLKMRLRPADQRIDAVDAIFFDATALPSSKRLRVAFRLDVNRWNDGERLQLLVRHVEAG